MKGVLLMPVLILKFVQCFDVFYGHVKTTTPGSWNQRTPFFIEPICNCPPHYIGKDTPIDLPPDNQPCYIHAGEPQPDFHQPKLYNMTCTLQDRTVCRYGRYTYVINNGRQRFDELTLKSFIEAIHANIQVGETDFNVTVQTPPHVLNSDDEIYVPVPFSEGMLNEKDIPVTVECTPVDNVVLKLLCFEEVTYWCCIKLMALAAKCSFETYFVESGGPDIKDTDSTNKEGGQRRRRHIHSPNFKIHKKQKFKGNTYLASKVKRMSSNRDDFWIKYFFNNDTDTLIIRKKRSAS